MSKSVKIGLVISGAMILAPVLGFAQTRNALKQDIQGKRQELRQNVKEQRETLHKDIQDKAQEFRKNVGEKRDILMREIKEKRESFRVEIQDKREVFKEEAQKRREELKKRLGEKRAENIEWFFGNMAQKFENAVDRLEKFAGRIEGHLNKAKAKGKDVVSLENQLSLAREKITAAQNALEDAKTRYSQVAGSSDFKTSFKKVKELVKSVAEKVKEAHHALVEVVNSINGLGVEKPATTTPTTP